MNRWGGEKQPEVKMQNRSGTDLKQEKHLAILKTDNITNMEGKKIGRQSALLLGSADGDLQSYSVRSNKMHWFRKRVEDPA